MKKMSELKDLGLGIPGPEHLREALTNCTDPLATIEDFQVDHCVPGIESDNGWTKLLSQCRRQRGGKTDKVEMSTIIRSFIY